MKGKKVPKTPASIPPRHQAIPRIKVGIHVQREDPSVTIVIGDVLEERQDLGSESCRNIPLISTNSHGMKHVGMKHESITCPYRVLPPQKMVLAFA